MVSPFTNARDVLWSMTHRNRSRRRKSGKHRGQETSSRDHYSAGGHVVRHDYDVVVISDGVATDQKKEKRGHAKLFQDFHGRKS